MRFTTMMISPAAYPAILSLLALASPAIASNAEPSTTTTACTASSTSGSFFDLRPDAAIKAKSDGSRPSHSRRAPLSDYKVRGYDYGANFTLNICNAVVEPIENVKGIEESKWQNISAYYDFEGDHYSLGFQSADPVTRGKELVLQYTGGSPCGPKKKSKTWSLNERSNVHAGATYRNYDEDDDDDDEGERPPPPDETDGDDPDEDDDKDDEDDVRRKSTTIFFSCDRDALAGSAQVSFIATDPDECNYVFKVKSAHACAAAEPHKPGSVGPGSVFAIILVVAVLVYLLGGVFYNRTVGNARGWRQLPNYSMWASVWSFICVSRSRRVSPDLPAHHSPRFD
jgi:cation-dependent mannose-6-phosphate receptor